MKWLYQPSSKPIIILNLAKNGEHINKKRTGFSNSNEKVIKVTKLVQTPKHVTSSLSSYRKLY